MSIALIVITAIFVLAAIFGFRSRPSWWLLRERAPDQGLWQRLYTPEQMPVTLSALQAISDAFLLRQDDIYRLRPEDKLLAIYRAAYPSEHTPDSLEFEVLSDKLMRQFHVPESVLAQYNDPSVQDIVQLCLKNGGA
jgi:hypothetical protein